MTWPTPTPSSPPRRIPEGTARLAEQRAKFVRYLQDLPREQADVVFCVDLYEMSLGQTAEALGREETTAASQLTRARKKLAARALESTRATEAGERRRPPANR